MNTFWLLLALGASQAEALRQAPKADWRADPNWSKYRQHYNVLPPLERHHLEPLKWRGLQVMAQRFEPQGKPRATVHVLHGYFDHTGLQSSLINALVGAGFTVRSLDLPGHGLSQGPRGEIETMADYQEVLQLWLGSATKPLRIVAHSNGAAVVMEAMRRGRISAQAKVALLAPLVRWSWWRSTGFLHWSMGWMIKSVPRRFRYSSADPAFERLRRTDPLQPKRIPMNWTRAMRRWEKRFSASAALPHAPTVLQGSADNTIAWRHNQAVIQRIFPRALFHLLRGAYHHLQGETAAIRKVVLRMVIESVEGDLP